MTFGRWVESAVLSCMSRVIEYRALVNSLLKHELEGNIPGIVDDCIAFFRQTIFFENLYPEEIED